MSVRWLFYRYLVVVMCAAGCCLLGSGVAQAASPPVIESESAYNGTLDAATLQAQLNPEGSETTYHFEYGTSTAYGSSAPIPDGPAGSGSVTSTVEAQLKGLTAGTLYHYRLVATSGGEAVDGADRVFTTFAVTPAALPDERAYELVSPPDKNGGEIDGGIIIGDVVVPEQASEDGNAVTYASASSFGATPDEAKGSATASSYISRHGSDGWSTQNVTPLSGATNEPNPLGVTASTVEGMAPDLSSDFFLSSSSLLSGSVPGQMMPYLQSFASGGLPSPLSPIAPPHNEEKGTFDPVFDGASSDFRHIIFSANDTLTPEAAGGGRNLYEWADGQLRLVNILPDGSVLSGEDRLNFGSSTPVVSGENLSNAISTDGSRIFWSDEVDKQLFARVDGTSTVLVSRSQKTNGTGPGGTDPVGTQPPVYQGASADGSYVFFTSTEELTNDANTGDAASCGTLQGDCAADLYRYNMNSGQLTDLTADAADSRGAEVQGVLGSSEDGSYVYFVANGVLASGATPGTCKSGGLCNLYVWHEGTGARFVVSVPGNELGSGPIISGKSGQAVAGISSERLGDRVSRVSPDGRFLAFQSTQSLTGYDNTVAEGSDCAGAGLGQFGEHFSADCSEVFLYEAASGRLVCASCNRTGARPTGPSVLPFRVGGALGHPLYKGISGLGWTTEVYQQRYLGDSGRLFFDSEDALSPRDTNGQPDVYEYENGEARLISGGFGGEPSVFIDASTSADDVFFLTRDQLTSEDRDEAVDMYDARAGALPALASPPPCASSDACKPGPSPQPAVFGAPASATFSGAGNLVQPGPAKAVKHKSAPKHRKRKVRPKHKKKKAKRPSRSGRRATNGRKR